MSPTTDDLRALLERRAESAPPDLVHAGSSGARLTGVRQRIRRRRQARATAAALSLALLTGSAAVVAQVRDRDRAVQPAFPAVDAPAVQDSAGRPLAVVVVAQPGRPAAVTVRLRSGAMSVSAQCAGPIRSTSTSDSGWSSEQQCAGSVNGTLPAGSPARPSTFRLSAGDGDPRTGTARLALYGDVEVLAVVQPAVASPADGAPPALPSAPGPQVGVDDADTAPRTGEITVAAGHGVTVALAPTPGWRFRTACTSTRLGGTVRIGGAVQALRCTPRGEVRADVTGTADGLELVVGPGSGYVRLALDGATVTGVGDVS